MEQYIKKSILVAEIERRINEINLDIIEDWRYRLQREHDIKVMKNILSIIDTLEVKEVDLEKEIDLDTVIDAYMDKNFGEPWDGARPVGSFELAIMAEHFFELGLKAQKGE